MLVSLAATPHGVASAGVAAVGAAVVGAVDGEVGAVVLPGAEEAVLLEAEAFRGAGGVLAAVGQVEAGDL